MKVSVVIPTHQRQQTLARTLPSIFAQDFNSEDYEVIVVVDGSTDGTLDFLRELPRPRCAWRVVNQPNQGLSSARNTGLRTAAGQIVLFLDDDLLCSPQLVRRHFEAHCRPGAWIISGLILPLPGPRNLAAEVGAAHLHYLANLARSFPCPRWPQVDCGANDSVYRAALLAAGGYNENFRDMREEADLGLRLWNNGVRMRHEPDAVSYHIFEKTVSEVAGNESVRFARGELQLCRTHPAYRPFSRFARMFNERWTRRIAKQTAARLPGSEQLLWAMCTVAESSRKIPGMRKLAVRLLCARMATVELRTAIRELGSWRAFKQEFNIPSTTVQAADPIECAIPEITVENEPAHPPL